jgi:XRE family aerobic/anaerobic benzoate catabolism transcriptional regulator
MREERTLRASLARAVRHARRARGLTQRALAAGAGVGEKYLSRIERGLVTPSVLVVSKLAGALGVRVEELLAPPSLDGPPRAAPILRLLAGRSESDLERAERVLRALFD